MQPNPTNWTFNYPPPAKQASLRCHFLITHSQSCEYQTFFLSIMIRLSVHHSLTVVKKKKKTHPLQKKTEIILRVVHIWPGLGSLWSCNDLPVTITLSCDDRAVCTCPAERCSQAHSCCALLPISVSQHTCLALTHTHTHTSFTHIQTHTNGSCSLFLRSYTARHCLSVKTVLLFFSVSVII